MIKKIFNTSIIMPVLFTVMALASACGNQPLPHPDNNDTIPNDSDTVVIVTPPPVFSYETFGEMYGDTTAGIARQARIDELTAHNNRLAIANSEYYAVFYENGNTLITDEPRSYNSYSGYIGTESGNYEQSLFMAAVTTLITSREDLVYQNSIARAEIIVNAFQQLIQVRDSININNIAIDNFNRLSQNAPPKNVPRTNKILKP